MKSSRFEVEKAREGDLAAILQVMRPWNMHHVPSPEMGPLDLEKFFVVRVEGKVVGAAGYTILSPTVGKTTLLGVLPEFLGTGIGDRLQRARCEAMFWLGAQKVITNADRPRTIAWYKKRYGYREVGRLEKLHSFGDPAIDDWTTLEMDLVAYMTRRARPAASGSALG